MITVIGESLVDIISDPRPGGSDPPHTAELGRRPVVELVETQVSTSSTTG